MLKKFEQNERSASRKNTKVKNVQKHKQFPFATVPKKERGEKQDVQGSEKKGGMALVQRRKVGQIWFGEEGWDGYGLEEKNRMNRV